MKVMKVIGFKRSVTVLSLKVALACCETAEETDGGIWKQSYARVEFWEYIYVTRAVTPQS